MSSSEKAVMVMFFSLGIGLFLMSIGYRGFILIPLLCIPYVGIPCFIAGTGGDGDE